MVGIVTKSDRWDLITEAFSKTQIGMAYIGGDDITSLVPSPKHYLNPNELQSESAVMKVISEWNPLFFMTTSGNDNLILNDAKLGGIFSSKILYIGPSQETIMNCNNKHLAKELFDRENIRNPKWIYAENKQSINAIDMKFPVVIKRLNGWSGYMQNVVRDQEKLVLLLDQIEYPALIEEHISGVEFSVDMVVWDKDYFFYPLVYKGRTDLEATHPLSKIRICPAPVSEVVEKQIQECARKVCETLNIQGYVDIDIILSDSGDIYILEVNPRFSGATRLVNMSSQINPYEVLIKKAYLKQNYPYFNTQIAIEVPIFKQGNVPASKDQIVYYTNRNNGTLGTLCLTSERVEHLYEKFNSMIPVFGLECLEYEVNELINATDGYLNSHYKNS